MKRHPEAVEEMRRLFIAYVKSIYPRNEGTDRQNSGNSGIPPIPHRLISAGSTYPSLAGVDVEGLSKQKLVNVMRNYCTQHYSE